MIVSVSNTAPAAPSDGAILARLSTTASGAENVTALMTAIIAAGMSGGGRVTLPAGTFPWRVPANGTTTGCFYLQNIANVTIEGAGMHSTVLRDEQAASTGGDFHGNPNGRNAFLTFVDPVNVSIRHIGLYGAARYDQASLDLGGVTSRQGITFAPGTRGAKKCVVEYCWFSHTEGENFVVQGAANTPAEDCICRFSHFERVLDNIINVNCGDRLGSFRCGAYDNTVVDSGSGALFLAGGTDLFFRDNTAHWTGISEDPGTDGIGNVLFQGADLVDLSSYDSPCITGNTARGYRVRAGTALVHCGGLGGGLDACNGASIIRNSFIDCSFLGAGSGHAGGIVIDGTAAPQSDFLIEANRFTACFGFAAADDLAAVRIIGTTDLGRLASPCAGVVSVNHHASGGVKHPIAAAVLIDATVVPGQEITVLSQNCSPTMMTPYVFAISPKHTTLTPVAPLGA